MTAGVLAGCSTKEEPKDDSGNEQNQTAEEEVSDADKVEAVEKTQVYVAPEWVNSVVQGQQEESADYVILECSWGPEDAAEAYAEAHIPGAIHMNTDNIEEEEYWNVRSAEEIGQLMRDFGITRDTAVICYGSDSVNAADDRVAFALLWAGVENVKCLDGGFETWTAAGYETETTSNQPTVAEAEFGVEIPAHPEYILTADEVKDKLANDDNFKLVSIRSEAEFLGETSGYGYIDKAGEPRGAIWGHDTDDGSYANADGTTVGMDVLERCLQESGASLDNEISFYCGTGWRATIPFLIMYQNGDTGMSLYDGGWFVWIMDDSNEVQVGDPAGDDCVYTTVGELSNDKAVQ